MNSGAIAFLDALGFKDIWQRFSPTDVLSRLELVQEGFQRNVMTTLQMPGLSLSTRALFLSDTVVIGTWRNPGLDDVFAQCADLLCLLTVVHGANTVQHSWLLKEPCLTFRGCVASGEFLVSENGQFIVGPAVDEAANGERRAQGPFVWLTDGAEALLSEATTTEWYNAVFVDWLRAQIPLLDIAVPFKDGTERTRKVVLPVSNIPFPPGTVLRELFLATFNSTRQDVVMKKRNAVPLIDASLAWIRDNPFRLL